MSTIMQVNAQNAITEKRKLAETHRSNVANEYLKHESNLTSLESSHISTEGRVRSAEIGASASIYGANLNAATTMNKTQMEQSGLWMRQLESQKWNEQQNALNRQVDWYKAMTTNENTKYANETGRMNAVSTRMSTEEELKLNRAKGIDTLTPNNTIGAAINLGALSELYGEDLVKDIDKVPGGKVVKDVGDSVNNAVNYVFSTDGEGNSLLSDVTNIVRGSMNMGEYYLSKAYKTASEVGSSLSSALDSIFKVRKPWSLR